MEEFSHPEVGNHLKFEMGEGEGAEGEGPHAVHEHILIDEVPVRSALLASLVARI